MNLFQMPKNTKKDNNNKVGSKIKLKRGQDIDYLVETANKLVDEKLGKYKDFSRLILHKEELEEFFNNLPDNSELAIDTETTGLETYQDELVGISLCDGKQALYVPINHKSIVLHQRIENQITPDELREILDNIFRTRKFKYIYHNGHFDISVLSTFMGYIIPAPYWDTMIAANLFNQDESHGLKELYVKYIEPEDDATARFDNLFQGLTADYIPVQTMVIYAGKDAYMTRKLYEYQKEKMDTLEMEGIKYVFKNIEMPLMIPIEEMQRVGIALNETRLKELQDKYKTKLKEVEEKVYIEIEKYQSEINDYISTHINSKLENPVNLASPVQLSILFYDIIGYKIKEGRGTGVHELEEINTPLTQALLEYRKIEKLITAFLEALPNGIEPFDNKVHTTLNQYGAATGRFSSHSPNLQQIPSHGEASEIRQLFCADKGQVLISCDYSQQEPRTCASLCNDEKMIGAYMEGKDLYATMASEVYDLPYEDCLEFYLDENGNKTDKTNKEGKKRRSSCKALLLGIMYGRGTASIAEQLNCTVEEAQEIIDKFYIKFSSLKTYTEQVQKDAKQNGYTTTAWGRRRYLMHIQDNLYEYSYNENRKIDFNPLFIATTAINKEVKEDIKDNYTNMLEKANNRTRYKIIDEAYKNGITIKSNSSFIAEAKRQCLNSIVQGSASDETKLAIINISKNKELKNLGYKLLFPIHDELLGMCPFENRKRVSELVMQEMINAPKEKIIVPMKCDACAFAYWYGPEISFEDTKEALAQYNDFMQTGKYKEEEEYIQ